MVVVDPEKTGSGKELMPKYDWNISRGDRFCYRNFPRATPATKLRETHSSAEKLRNMISPTFFLLKKNKFMSHPFPLLSLLLSLLHLLPPPPPLYYTESILKPSLSLTQTQTIPETKAKRSDGDSSVFSLLLSRLFSTYMGN